MKLFSKLRDLEEAGLACTNLEEICFSTEALPKLLACIDLMQQALEQIVELDTNHNALIGKEVFGCGAKASTAINKARELADG